MEETVVGQFLQPAGQNWYDEVVKERQVDDVTLVYFKNGFTCNIKTCRKKDEKTS